MSGSRRRSGSGQSSGASFALSAAVAAAGAIAGAVAVEHAQAQAEGRPSVVESAWRWVTEELLGDEGAARDVGGGGGRRRNYGRLSAADVAALPTREYAPCSGEEGGESQKAFCPVCQEGTYSIV